MLKGSIGEVGRCRPDQRGPSRGRLVLLVFLRHDAEARLCCSPRRRIPLIVIIVPSLFFGWRRYADCRFEHPTERATEPRTRRFDRLGNRRRVPADMPSAGRVDPVEVVIGRLERTRQEGEVERVR